MVDGGAHARLLAHGGGLAAPVRGRLGVLREGHAAGAAGGAVRGGDALGHGRRALRA